MGDGKHDTFCKRRSVRKLFTRLFMLRRASAPIRRGLCSSPNGAAQCPSEGGTSTKVDQTQRTLLFWPLWYCHRHDPRRNDARIWTERRGTSPWGRNCVGESALNPFHETLPHTIHRTMAAGVRPGNQWGSVRSRTVRNAGSSVRIRPPSVVERLGFVRTRLTFALLYASIYGAFGVASPFWPQYFESRGVTIGQLGTLLGFGTLVRLISGPLVARVADISGAIRGILAGCAMLAACVAVSLTAARGFWPVFLVHIAQSAALAPVTTLADTLALNASERRADDPAFEYGWVRGLGSASFVLATLVMGHVLSLAGLSSFVWTHAALLLAAVLGTPFLVPLHRCRPEAAPLTQLVWHGVAEMFEIRQFRRIVFVAALIFGSHAVHDAFAVIRWSQAGIPPWMISILWSEAVAAEVFMFFLLGPILINRLGPGRAAALAAVAGVIRWVAMAQTTSPLAIGIVQPLHGLTFALLHLACMRVIATVVPQRLAATAQAGYAFGPGLSTALLTMASGELYAAFG
jgi:MFS transporter, PPP family, 3-phenylpropionic acid transporter